jgi:5-methylcytosine-specific restriction endonuclease McrA
MTGKAPTSPCLNCDQPTPPVSGQAKLYCSEECAEEAKTVRYVRGCIRDGRIEKPDVREAVQIRLAIVVGGGYPEKERHVPPATRKAVIERDGGLCKQCGRPGTDVDHIEGSSNEMENLQLLCRACHNKKTITGFVPMSPEHREKANELHARINARKPMRPCDDDQRWMALYPQIQAERRAALKAGG